MSPAFLFLVTLQIALGEQLWPLPQNVQSLKTSFFLDPENFAFKAVGSQSSILTNAFERYYSLLFFQGAGASTHTSPDTTTAQLFGLNVDVVDPSLDLGLTTNESYTLTVSGPVASLEAQTVFGALRGLETFSQWVDHNGETYTMAGVVIADWPRFQHRGFLIDTSRHFISVPVILQFIDALAYNKFNVLHWHIVDDQSFPYQSINLPNLTFGAYGWPSYSHVYTPEEVQDVITYALYRGVRVIPEFDTPGHTLSWGVGNPSLLTQCYTNGQPVPGSLGPINPLNPDLTAFLTDLFTELQQVFPDQYVHIGGDEVSFACWESNPQIQQWMAQQGETDYSFLEFHYESGLLNVLDSIGKDYICWEDVFDNGVSLRPSTVVEVWRGNWNATMAAVTAAGYRAILSSPWYLNYFYTVYAPEWPIFYQVEPLAWTGTAAQKALVMGGEACMWGEFTDATDLNTKSWPNGCAVGERLWSAESVTSVSGAEGRILAQRCRLLRRNIPAGPVQPGYCPHEYAPPYIPPWQTGSTLQ